MATEIDRSEKSLLIGEPNQSIGSSRDIKTLKHRLLSSISNHCTERFIIFVTLAICWSTGILNVSLHPKNNTFLSWRGSPTPQKPYICHPPLPAVLRSLATPPTGPQFLTAARTLDAALTLRAALPDMDSISLAVVTPSGPIFSKTYGALRANETDPRKRGKPDEDSLYRIASISKMFNVYEMMILREKGLLNWDDPVQKYIKNFTYYSGGWEEYLSESHEGSAAGDKARKTDPITLRQLATHMAGIGRDYPPINIPSWPKIDRSKIKHKPPNSTEPILEMIKELPLVAPPYTYPIYSNAGFNVLGWAVATAAGGKPEDYPDLLRRDIFEPLGLSSAFNVTEETAAKVAVPRLGSYEVDLDLGPYNPAGGQFSSLRDLTKVMQTFLNPSRADSLLSPYAMREWLRPLHGFPDDLTEVGAPWEIIKVPDTNGNPRRWYSKTGNLRGSHSVFVFDPTTSFGVIVLMTGLDHKALKIGINAIQIYQSAFDKLVEQTTMELYGGYWQSEDKQSVAITYVEKGSLWLSRLFLNGTDVFEQLEGPQYPRGRRGAQRLAKEKGPGASLPKVVAEHQEDTTNASTSSVESTDSKKKKKGSRFSVHSITKGIKKLLP
ncbi:hypothetical protein FRC04_001198 [Tulasnella sp. 424]|nr:hypothetical protein FRC04_001198 [Tulasnella sp. 424]KAG8975782.1 hypothetical protein FRC05_004992 [Tulasnella sp. 425]